MTLEQEEESLSATLRQVQAEGGICQQTQQGYSGVTGLFKVPLSYFSSTPVVVKVLVGI